MWPLADATLIHITLLRRSGSGVWQESSGTSLAKCKIRCGIGGRKCGGWVRAWWWCRWSERAAAADAIYQQIQQAAYEDPFKMFTNPDFDWSEGYIKDFAAKRYASLQQQAASN